MTTSQPEPISDYDDHSKVEEIKIKVPWGHLSGKWWGPKNIRPVVAIHGWLDNAASFDPLIPLLPKHLSYLAIDSPGHGLSSPIPAGFTYSSINNLHCLHLVRMHFRWEKLSLMGHSLGATTSFTYAGLFPAHCDLIIAFDCLKPMVPSPEIVIDRWVNQIVGFHMIDKKNQQQQQPALYDYDGIVDRFVAGSNSSITRDVTPLLMERSTAKIDATPPQYHFTHDRRLRAFEFTLVPHEVSVALAKRMKIPYLLLRATDGQLEEEEHLFQEVFDILRVNNKLFEWAMVDGKHHFHLTDPSAISRNVSDFLSRARPV